MMENSKTVNPKTGCGHLPNMANHRALTGNFFLFWISVCLQELVVTHGGLTASIY